VTFPPKFLDEVRSRVSLAEVVGRRVHLVKRGREFVGLCPFHNEKTPSFSVVEDKGFYHCFGCGAHSDVFGFAMQSGKLSFTDAVEQLARQAGVDIPSECKMELPQHHVARRRYASLDRPAPEVPARDPEGMDAIAFAEAIRAQTVPAGGTIVERYWRDARGLSLPIPPVIHFGAAVPYGRDKPGQPPPRRLPAMVAEVHAVDGSFAGVHVTYLLPDGSGKDRALPKSRLMFGRVRGCAIRLSEACDELAIGEGIESTASFMQDHGIAGWAGMSASLIPSIVLPPPPIAFAVVLLGENDDSGASEKAVVEARARLRLDGRLVRLVFPAEEWKDFNDPHRRAAQ
jgi:CHC2 zinc finger/Toprim domain